MATEEVIDVVEASQQTTWQEIVAKKRQHCLDAIPKDWLLPNRVNTLLKFPLSENPNRLIELGTVKESGILTQRELDITENHTVSDLLLKLASGQLSCYEVTLAFCKRAAIAQQLTSCLTETLFPEALARAKGLDQQRADGKPLGPLHGLPVSLKDSFQIKGKEASIGYVSFLGRIADENAPLVDILLSLGAVIYVKTNIPQSMMTADSENNIFGRTLNPNNTFLSAGGSSGGEGALVAFRGSPLGVGTDVAGSVRIPAFANGTYGFKPTSSRVPYGGQAIPGLPGFKPITASAGPLANDFDALEIFTRAVLDTTPALLDSTAIDVPWRRLESVAGRKLRIGFMPECPTYPLHPPVRRALNEAIAKLKAAGHDVIPLNVKDCHVADSVEVARELFGLAAATGAIKRYITASGEPVIKSLAKDYKASTHGNYNWVPDLSKLDFAHSLAALTVKRQEISENWRKLWSANGLDIAIGPVSQSTAVAHDTFEWPAYTSIFNVLDFPALTIPVSRASKARDPEIMRIEPGQSGPDYIPEEVDGAPVCLQVFHTRMRDEECLQMGREIDRCLKL